jgi:predicted site-specific integrase-resolvase
VNRYQRYDENFKQFGSNYKDVLKKYPNVLDLTRFAEDQTLLLKDEQLNQDEVEMLKEFSKRRYEQRKQKQEFEVTLT